MHELRVHQFMQGDSEDSDPVYYTNINEFWNINSLVRSLCNTSKSGITLNLIREPNNVFSYFAFGIRNGGTVTVLTDKPHFIHPLQQYMTRRPGRELSERAYRLHFPYDLLELEFDRKGDAYAPASTDIVAYQTHIIRRTSIQNLKPDEVIWTVLMFSLIQEKFFTQNYKSKQLSYTGEMIRIENPYENEMNKLQVNNYTPISAKYINANELMTKDIETQIERKSTGINDWIDKRYSDNIDSEMLNLLGFNTENVLLLPETNEITTKSKIKASYGYHDTEIILKNSVELVQLGASEFGTKEELIRDQIWLARYNKANLLQNEVDKEFNETKDSVFKWYENAIRNNMDNILDAVANGQLKISPVHYRSFGEDNVTSDNLIMLSVDEKYQYSLRIDGVRYGLRLYEGERYDKKCFLNGSQVSVYAYIKPTTSDHLALLCNCAVSDLPEVLQNWATYDSYVGNSILDRLDPVDWVIQNPWTRKIGFGIVMYLSKSGYSKLRKDRGLPPNKFWLEEEKGDNRGGYTIRY